MSGGVVLKEFEINISMDFSGSGTWWEGLYNPPEGNIYKWYISGIYCQLGSQTLLP